jgi:hypothetical protein
VTRRKKNKKKKYDPAAQVRRLARAVLGTPPAGRVLPNKKNRPAKHKRRELGQELEN